MGPNGLPLTLLSNTQAQPSANLSGNASFGQTQGSLLPGQSYGSNSTTGNQLTSSNPMGAYNLPSSTQAAQGATTGGNNSGSNSTSNGNGNTPANDPYDRNTNPDAWARYLGYSNGMQGYLDAQNNAAASQASANIQAATNMYNNLRAQLETQRPVIDSAYNKGLADVQNQINTGVQQGNAQQGLLSSQYQAGQGQLGQGYQQSQAENRELARAMGGNGSDYAQLQNKTNNSYQNNMFQAYNDYTTRSQQISQGIQSLQNWGQAQKDSLATQYQQGINQLVLNENMTDFSKAQAIQQIQSDYQKNLANIQGVVAQFGNQLMLAKAQVDSTAAMFGKAIQGYDPLANMANMYFGTLGSKAPTVDTSGGISYPNNKTAGGINTNNQTPAAGF